MKKQLKIGDILLSFEYQFHDFFGNQLEQYHVEDLGSDYHTLEVFVQDTIEDVDGDNKSYHNNKVKITTDNKTYVVTYNPDKSIKHLIAYTNNYKHITIILSKGIGKRLAEYEYVFSGMLFFEIAISNGYLPIHASAIEVDNKAVLLCGPSSSGKSTQTKYFQEVFPDSIIINEDKPLIYELEDKLYVCGSPWSGKLVLNKNITVELGSIFFVNKADKTAIIPISMQQIMKELMRNIHRPGDEDNMNNTIYLLEKIMEKIDIFQFDCVNNKSSSLAIKEYLEEER